MSWTWIHNAQCRSFRHSLEQLRLTEKCSDNYYFIFLWSVGILIVLKYKQFERIFIYLALLKILCSKTLVSEQINVQTFLYSTIFLLFLFYRFHMFVLKVNNFLFELCRNNVCIIKFQILLATCTFCCTTKI